MKGNFLGLGEKTEGRTNLEGNPVPKARMWTSLEKDGGGQQRHWLVRRPWASRKQPSRVQVEAPTCTWSQGITEGGTAWEKLPGLPAGHERGPALAAWVSVSGGPAHAGSVAGLSAA